MEAGWVSSERPALNPSNPRRLQCGDAQHPEDVMRIHMGIMCERCRKVHFIATSSAIQFSRSCGGIYRLNCPAPCSESREFRKEHTHPYRAADDVFQRGSATEGEYEPLPSQRSPLNYLIA
jgi:hypothetical protein